MAKSLQEQREELEKKLAEIQQQEAQIVEQKKGIIAEVVWSEMQKNAELTQQITALLQEKVVKNSDRQLFELPKRERKAKADNGGVDVGNG